MDKTYPPEAWKRLGKRLEERRRELGYGFRQRRQFLHDHGGPPPSSKMLDRLENGARTYYPDTTIATLERLYGYERGSFEAILLGGEPTPADVAPAPPSFPEPPTAAEEARERFPGDQVSQAIWRLPNTTEAERWEMIATLERKRREIHARKSQAS